VQNQIRHMSPIEETHEVDEEDAEDVEYAWWTLAMRFMYANGSGGGGPKAHFSLCFSANIQSQQSPSPRNMATALVQSVIVRIPSCLRISSRVFPCRSAQ
jgi:hypothetical protein